MPVARPADGPYGLPPARPVSRSSSHTPTPMLARPISRAASPVPPGMVRSTDIRGSASTDFQIEKAPKSPGPFGRPMPQREDYNRNEQMFRQQVTALIAAMGQQIIASGRVSAGPTPLVLFFRTKVGPFHISCNTISDP